MKCGRGRGVAPVADQNQTIDGAEAGSLIVSGCGGETGLSWYAVVAAGDIVKNGRSARPLPGRQRLERGVGIALPGC